MIRTKYKDKDKTHGEVILYSKDGKRVLGREEFRTEKGKDRAMNKIKKREKQVEYFKNK